MENNTTECIMCGKTFKEHTIYESPLSGHKHHGICLDCLDILHSINSDTDFSPMEAITALCQPKPSTKNMKPYEIKEFLDKYVVGQEEAKKILSVAAYNHMKRLNMLKINKELELDKSNVIMVGPSGSGKTHLIRSLAKLFNVPYAIADATTLTESGYVGSDTEVVLQKLYFAAKGDISAAERGIVFIDEIDKKATKGKENTSITRDVSGEGVQQSLLKLLEGTNVEVQLTGSRKHPYSETVTINTQNILFIVSGAFPGIERIIERRTYKKSVNHIGLTEASMSVAPIKHSYNELIDKITAEDLRSFGLIPEFIGRLPVICPLKQLSEEELCDILIKPKNAIVKQFSELMLHEDGLILNFTDEALKYIAHSAIEDGTGARGLRARLEKVLLEPMFTCQKKSKNKTVNITSEYIKKVEGKNIKIAV